MLLVLLWNIGCGSKEARPEPAAALPASPPPLMGTVWDPSTRMSWTRCPAGMQEERDPDTFFSSCTGTPRRVFYEEAEEYCATLALAGLSWRLPALVELQTLTVCPDGNAPDVKNGCEEPHYQASYNALWFPGEGDPMVPAEYWAKAVLGDKQELVSRFVMNQGAAGDASVAQSRLRVRCVSEGRSPKSEEIAAQVPGLPDPDPDLKRVQLVGNLGATVWSEPSISGPVVGALTPGQLVIAGEPGPFVKYQDREDHFVRVQGLPWSGWTLAGSLGGVPGVGVLEAVDAVWAVPAGFSLDSDAVPAFRERLVAGQQYRLVELVPGRARVALLSGEGGQRIGEAPAHGFRWVEPLDFVCRRRIDALTGENKRLVPPMMEPLWPRDAQACERYEAIPMEAVFPGSREVWRLHGVGGFEGYLVDGVAVAGEARASRSVGDLWVVGGVGDPEGDACGCLRVLRFVPGRVEVVWERGWLEGEQGWKVEADGRISGRDGAVCRQEGGGYVCAK